jgi:hypothetical protein
MWDDDDDEVDDEFDDDEENEEDEDDEQDPYGEDQDPYGDDDNTDPWGGDEDLDNEKDDKDEEKDDKEKDKDKDKDDDKEKKKLKAEKDNHKYNSKAIFNKARSIGLVPIPIRSACPFCHTTYLFPDTVMSTSLRYVKKLIFPTNPEETSVKRYLCMNPKCHYYYCTTGYKFMRNESNKLVPKRSIFFIPK